MDNETTTPKFPGDGFVTAKAWAELNGVDPRTVKRWLGNGEIPGAEQRGKMAQWFIPETAMRKEPTTTRSEVAVPETISADLVDVEPDPEIDEEIIGLFAQELTFYLDRLPGHIPVRLAARLLGLGVEYVRQNGDEYGLIKRGGPNQSDVIPKRLILRKLGLDRPVVVATTRD